MDFPILIIGDCNRHEFREPCAQLFEHGATAAANIPAALELLHANLSPALIVIAQRWPGEYSARELAELKRAAPLARFVGVLGPWLEGEARTGKPWPTMQRVYWHQALARQGRALASFCEVDSLLWTLPITSSDDERTLATIVEEAIHFETGSELYDPTAPLIVIFSPHRETAESLVDVCANERWNSIWLREPPTATPVRAAAVVVDFRSNLSAAIANCNVVNAIKRATGDAPIVAIAGFPRADEVPRLQLAGVSAVVSKPFLGADLIWQIEQILANAAANESGQIYN